MKLVTERTDVSFWKFHFSRELWAEDVSEYGRKKNSRTTRPHPSRNEACLSRAIFPRCMRYKRANFSRVAFSPSSSFFFLPSFSFLLQLNIYIYRRRRRNDFGGVSGWSNLYRWLYSAWVRDRSPNIYFQGLFRVVCILSSRYWLRHRAGARQGLEDGCLWYSVLVVSSQATPRTNANISRSRW